MTFYNTTHERGEILKEYRKKAATQESIIMRFFLENKDEIFSPDQVHSWLFDSKTPLTSIRRAMTTLTNKGLLEKNGKKRRGKFNRRCYCWQLKQEQEIK